MDTNMSLDTQKFLRRVIAEAKADIQFSYVGPFNMLSEDRAHTSLQRLSSKLQMLETFLNSVEVKGQDNVHP